MLYMAGFGTTRGLQWYLLCSRSMNYAEVIIVRSAANSTGIDYSAMQYILG
jgi:hypothetical protein